MSFSGDFSHSTPARILRDTGTSKSILLADRFVEESSTCTNVLFQCVDCCGFTTVLLRNVYLSSDLIDGPVTVSIRSALPFEGNDLYSYG